MERCLAEDRLFFEYYVKRRAIAESEVRCYEGTVAALQARTPRPHLIVHLQGDTGTLVERLERAYARGERAPELRGEDLQGYIETMNRIYARWGVQADRLCDRYVAVPPEDADVVAQIFVDQLQRFRAARRQT
jgi:deoxyadenosine/deoxycytidine kinase